MEYVDIARYWVGAILLISLPPAMGYWIIIHSFAAHLRVFGPKVILTIMFALLVLAAVNIFPFRDILLGTDLGSTPLLWIPAAPLLYWAFKNERALRKHLSLATLVGIPELREGEPGKLLNQGIYARVRHPRYANIFIAMIAYALFVNYLGFYLIVALTGAALYLITYLEERELRVRFGQDYIDYATEVPRLIPKI
jgi:protein-S-isoprenylcysteine O-methyltransferase Ste14